MHLWGPFPAGLEVALNKSEKVVCGPLQMGWGGIAKLPQAGKPRTWVVAVLHEGSDLLHEEREIVPFRRGSTEIDFPLHGSRSVRGMRPDAAETASREQRNGLPLEGISHAGGRFSRIHHREGGAGLLHRAGCEFAPSLSLRLACSQA